MAAEWTKEQILALSVMNPDLDAYIKANGEPPRPSMDVYVGREMMEKNLKARVMQMPVPEGVLEEEITIRARDGYEIPCRIHKPANSAAGPLILVFHAGGFVAGGPFQEFGTCRRYVKEHDAVCINVDYRLAPEYEFPMAVYDAYDVLEWVAKHAKELRADPSIGFIMAGTSAGANLSNACAHLARDNQLSPPLTGIALAVPITIAANAPPERYKDDYLSWEQNKDSVWMNQKSIVNFAQFYNPDRNSTLYAAIHADHKGLPRVYMQAAGLDPFRDDAIIYDKMLRNEAGVESKLDVYPGVPHGFWPIWPNLDISKKFIEDNTRGIGWLLRKNP